MAGKSVTFNTSWNFDSQLEAIAKWLSCNGEVWGVGPTAVFASAAALFLYNELEATLVVPGDQVQDVSSLEKTLISTMLVGMLALMIHLWVCCMRFFQYYLDTIIRDSPSMLLELTTAGLFGSPSEIVPLGPLTRFLRQQQPQIHITACWFLSLCYADYVRKHYCRRFNMPYLEYWQTELQDRVLGAARRGMEKVNSIVGSIHQRLRGYAQVDSQPVAQLNNEDVNTTPCSLNGMMDFSLKAVVRFVLTVIRLSCLPKFLWNQRYLERSQSGSPMADVKVKTVDVSATASRASCGLHKTISTTTREQPKEINARIVCKSSDTTADAIEKFRNYIKLYEKSKCGESSISVVPTVLWTVGAAALSQRLLTALFRRFLFRRVPLWEIILQNLLFIWMVMYSVTLWGVLVTIVKATVEYCYRNETEVLFLEEDAENYKVMQQWMIWICGAVPLAVYVQTRPRPEIPPLMIWITTSPWQRREMGPYGYYLNRPLSSLQSSTTLSLRQQALTLRRAFSDSKIIIKEQPKKKRMSKSV